MLTFYNLFKSGAAAIPQCALKRNRSIAVNSFEGDQGKHNMDGSPSKDRPKNAQAGGA